ncbi:MAG: ATP-binding cassette domain-containing protein [Campylobacterales bacterium]|nr:ATP-binding cassette domain-containing protein [Campylobacterales bacterium]
MFKINIEKKVFNKNIILEKFNLHIEKKEFISIIGPSGCGKSTILKILASLDEDYIGLIEYKKTNIINNIGFIFQDSRLLPWLSVLDNILLVTKNEKKSEIIFLLKNLGLEDYIYSYIKELSGGMKRRVSIIRAFINKPEVLFLDEPFVSLDYPNAQNLRELILNFYQEYSPIIILVTHNLEEALVLSNRIIFLSCKPTKIIYEYKNNRTFDEKLNNLKKEKILSKYPKILSGIL